MAISATAVESRQLEAKSLAAEAFTYLKEIEYWSKKYDEVALQLCELGFFQAGELNPINFKSDRYPDHYHHNFFVETKHPGFTSFTAQDLVDSIADGPEPSWRQNQIDKLWAKSNMPKETRQEILSRIGTKSEWRCVYCQKLGTLTNGPDERAWHIDHVYPQARGGDNQPDNLVLSCATCNLHKSAKLLKDAMAAKAVASVA